MRALLYCLLICASALPAFAGQGSIVETEDEIIVEYSGDASDKTADKPGSGAVTAPGSGSNPDSSGGSIFTTPAAPPAESMTGRVERPNRPNRRDRPPRQGSGDNPE